MYGQTHIKFIQHVSAAIAAIFKVILLLLLLLLLLQEYKGTHVVRCVAVTPYQLIIIIFSVQIM